jgi:SPP1 gp7 family putative phage head morphogenesis protein
MRAVSREVIATIRGAVVGLPMSDAADDPADDAAKKAAAIRTSSLAAMRIREALRRMRLPPPPLRVLEGVVEQAGTTAMRAARAGLIAGGAPRAALASRLGIDLQMLTGIDIAPSAAEQAVVVAWARQGTDLITSVGQDLVAGLDEHIAEAARTGALTSDLRQIVMDRLGVADRHAQFIARDQISKLNGEITRATQQAAGVTSYRWRSASDERTRPAHRALNDTSQRWDAPPVVDPKTGRREHPGGDFQCFLADCPVSGAFVAAIRGHYEGPAFEIKTSGGGQLSVTAKHPILTTRGFVMADELRVGDEVLCDAADVRRAVEGVDPEHGPALAAEVFGLLEMVGRLDACELRPDDLHGDAVRHHGHVDVVRTDGLLLHDVEAAAAQRVGDLGLPDADPALRPLVADRDLAARLVRLRRAARGIPSGVALAFGGALGALDALPLDPLLLRSRALGDASQPKNPLDLRTLEALAAGEREDAGAAGVVGAQSGGHVGRDGVRGAGVADLALAPSLPNAVDDRLVVDPETARGRTNRLASRVMVEQVIDIKENPAFSGHVFSLQTTTGLVVAGGIITSNCRCSAIPVMPDW